MYTLILSICCVLFVALAIKNLRLAVLFVLATLPSYLIRFQILGLPMTLLEAMILIVFIVSIARGMKIGAFPKTWMLPAGAIMFVATISVFTAPDFTNALGIWKAYFIEPILFFTVLRFVIKTEDDIVSAIKALGLGALTIGVFAIWQYFNPEIIPAPWDIEKRVTSFFQYPNAVGLYLAPIIILSAVALYRSMHKKNVFQGYYWWLILGVSAITIALSKTEAALVAIPATLFILSLTTAWTRLWSIPLAVLFVVIILLSPLRSPILNKITLQDYSGETRRSQWSETIEYLKDNPIFGSGLSGYPTEIVPYHKAKQIEIFQYPHNIILNTWVELGVLGLVAFTILDLRIIGEFRRAFKKSAFDPWLALGIFGALLVMFIHGLVDVPYFKNDLAVLTWALLALLSVERDRVSQVS